MPCKALTAQQRRLRVAAVTLAFLATGFLLLGLLSLREDAAGTAGAAGYLLSGVAAPDGDPLSLTGVLAGLELTGVSEDGSIVGYMSGQSVAELCLSLKDVLQLDGWSIDDDNGQGVLSFYRAGPDGTGKAALLVQCLPAGQGSSLVIKRW
jgi:hypothetical protein